MDKTTKSQIYNVIYSMADFEIKKINPCDFRDNRCVKDRKMGTTERCCSGCTYFYNHICSVEALGCKLELCFLVAHKYPGLHNLLRILKDLSTRCGISLEFRKSKEELLGG